MFSIPMCKKENHWNPEKETLNHHHHHHHQYQRIMNDVEQSWPGGQEDTRN